MADNSRIEDLKRRVQKDPASIAFAQLGEECRRAGQCQEAVDICRAGLAIHPGYLSARVTLGRALLEINQLEEAQAELELVLKSAPENLAAIRGLAETHQRRGNLIEALVQYRAALQLARNDPDLERTVRELSREIEPAESRPVVEDGLSLEQMQNELLKQMPPPAPIVAPPERELSLSSSRSSPSPSPVFATSELQGNADRLEPTFAARDLEPAEVSSIGDGLSFEQTGNERLPATARTAEVTPPPELSLSSPWPSLTFTTPEAQADADRLRIEATDGVQEPEPAQVQSLVEDPLAFDRTRNDLPKPAPVTTAGVALPPDLSSAWPTPVLTTLLPLEEADRLRAELTVAALEQLLAAIHVVRAGRVA